MFNKIISSSDYESWVTANSPNKFSLFDYLHGVFSTRDLEPDLAIAFFKFLWPEFICVDGLVFLKEEYSKSKYKELAQQENSERDLEYWMNLISIDGLFESATLEQSKYFGRQLVKMWRAKLREDFSDKCFIVDCVIDGNEVYSVFYQKNDL